MNKGQREFLDASSNAIQDELARASNHSDSRVLMSKLGISQDAAIVLIVLMRSVDNKTIAKILASYHRTGPQYDVVRMNPYRLR